MQSSVSRANGILLSFHHAILASTEIIQLLSAKNPVLMSQIYQQFQDYLN
ncbi:unnamed protein product [Callosobruchus maculatus]|uniref:Uncharacterized protein n=1 Tax=Callosobruchus maculatus TaxID=64391 RepID=A0A653CA44_CALMS|nr:unnamed protein product [Callosobruchus maculatus]